MPTRLSPGDRCAGYEISGFLGAGRSADVYAARAPTGRPCAFKIMSAPGAGNNRALFAQEGEALARIVHPNVVRVLDAGAWDDRVWLALELCEGETLGQRLRAGGRPPADEALDWLLQIAEGLAAAHAAGVLHRDVNVDNVLLTGGGRVKVIDFGMARLYAWGVRTSQEQQIGAGMNLAPEAAQGAPASATRDVYALGHVAYQLLAGVHAMGDAPRPMIEMVKWHLWEQPRPLRELAPWVPPDLAALVHEMLEKDPAKRPASMGHLLERLRCVCAGLRAPLLRAVRSVPGAEVAPALAPTIPMAAVEGAGDRPGPRADEPRATDVPVEAAARRSSVVRRRAPAAAFALAGIATLAAAGWLVAARLESPDPEPASAARPDASAPASAASPAAAAPVASASAPASSPPRPPPAKPPARRPPAPRAKNRLFGSDP